MGYLHSLYHYYPEREAYLVPSKSQRDKTLLAWRLAKHNGTSSFQRYPLPVGVKVVLGHGEDGGGDKLSRVPQVFRRILPGSWGLHGCTNPLSTLDYGGGLFVERVALSGLVVWYDKDDKHVASERTTLWRADATEALLLCAADATERALQAQEPGRVGVLALQGVHALRDTIRHRLPVAEVEAASHALGPRVEYESADAASLATDAVRRALSAALIMMYGSPNACGALIPLQAAFQSAARSVGWAEEERFSEGGGFVGRWSNAEAEETHWQAEALTARLQALAPAGFVEPSEDKNEEV